jgi:hypothetical protein
MGKRRLWYLGVLGVGVLAATLLLLGGSAVTSAGKPTPPAPPPSAKEAAAPKSAPIATTTFVCGAVAMASITLTQDENCPGTNGVFIGKNGITINLNGHTLTGDGKHAGVDDPGFNNVTVTNGVINNFQYGVVLIGNSSHATSLRVENATSIGIFTDGNVNAISNNYVLSSVIGVYATGAGSAR